MDVADLDVADLFASLSYESPRWQEAELEEAVVYLRTAKAVTVPLRFKTLIPKEFVH